jgi:hypothetical protein
MREVALNCRIPSLAISARNYPLIVLSGFCSPTWNWLPAVMEPRALNPARSDGPTFYGLRGAVGAWGGEGGLTVIRELEIRTHRWYTANH